MNCEWVDERSNEIRNLVWLDDEMVWICKDMEISANVLFLLLFFCFLSNYSFLFSADGSRTDGEYLYGSFFVWLLMLYVVKN